MLGFTFKGRHFAKSNQTFWTLYKHYEVFMFTLNAWSLISSDSLKKNQKYHQNIRNNYRAFITTNKNLNKIAFWKFFVSWLYRKNDDSGVFLNVTKWKHLKLHVAGF